MPAVSQDVGSAVTDLYRRLIDGWNGGDAHKMTAGLASDGLVVGFDGSQMLGRDEAEAELGHIFADHEVATYVTKIRSVKSLGREAGLLHAVAGMVPPAGDEIMPDRNVIQTVAARHVDDDWMVVLFQTTRAQFHGRPELVEALTAELTELPPGKPQLHGGR